MCSSATHFSSTLGGPSRWPRERPDLLPKYGAGCAGCCPSSGFLKRAHSFANYTLGGLGPYSRVRTGLPYFEERSLLGERLQGLRLPQRDLPESLDSARHLLDEVFQYHRRTHFTSEYMPKVDSSTMYYGLESRAPFLDHTLWEFAAGLSPEIHFQGGQAQGGPARNRAAAYRAVYGIAPEARLPRAG